jgi:hypothetical protein
MNAVEREAIPEAPPDQPSGEHGFPGIRGREHTGSGQFSIPV